MTPTHQNKEDIVSSWKVISMKSLFYILFKGQNCLMPFSPKFYSLLPLFPN